METQLDFFQALADPTRRLIVDALRSGERPAYDIVEQAGIHQSGVSRVPKLYGLGPGAPPRLSASVPLPTRGEPNIDTGGELGRRTCIATPNSRPLN
jgi:Bacterial regulatory protein, arsR family